MPRSRIYKKILHVESIASTGTCQAPDAVGALPCSTAESQTPSTLEARMSLHAIAIKTNRILQWLGGAQHWGHFARGLPLLTTTAL